MHPQGISEPQFYGIRDCVVRCHLLGSWAGWCQDARCASAPDLCSSDCPCHSHLEVTAGWEMAKCLNHLSGFHNSQAVAVGIFALPWSKARCHTSWFQFKAVVQLLTKCLVHHQKTFYTHTKGSPHSLHSKKQTKPNCISGTATVNYIRWPLHTSTIWSSQTTYCA